MKFSMIMILLILTSCSDDMKKYYRLGELRVLAITADTPEINTPSTVSVTPFISYPDGGDVSLSVNWQVCLDPGIALGAKIDCEESQFKIDNGSFTFDMTTLNTDFYTGNMTSVNVAIPASLFVYLGSLDNDIKFNGISVLVIFEISDPTSNKILKTFKRIKLTSKTSGLNLNPAVSGQIQVNNADVVSYPAESSSLSLDGVESSQSYEFSQDGQISILSEFLTISWFSNKGSFQFSRTDADDAVTFDPENETSGVIVAVVRDGRGGVTVLSNSF